ncbi:hypothetical protein PF004_g17695 [Phytophthora fragariae]|uniref:ZSWIM1/3 RNaseH-like domain-containing protein n=1 Tax=Phytophthora fragariae TaxID=53985 RepID=A0A6G0NEP9_9STRA|nr:hypothetical protein PF004_g17695 [Phytophthora fragariae]
MPDLPTYPGGYKKDVPPRRLAQSTIPDLERLIADRAANEKRRAENKARHSAIIARRRQRVEDIRSGKFLPALPPAIQAPFDALRAERLAIARNEAVDLHLAVLGRTMRTRSSDAKATAAGSAQSEVLAQLDEEDEEGEPSASDSDYDDQGDDVHQAGDDAGDASAEESDDNAGDDAAEGTLSSDKEEESNQDEESDAGRSDKCEGSEAGSSDDCETASVVSQKRHRKGYRKSKRKAARTATTKSPRGERDDEDGAFLEGFSCRWSSWDAFHGDFEDFQAATYQQFASRTSTSVASRNKKMSNSVAREAKASGDTREVVERRKGTRYIPEEWKKYCKTLRCTHGRCQSARGTGQRKHRVVRATMCTAKVNARVVPGRSGWYVALKASGHHNHPVTKHQWFNYAESRKITDEGLTRDAEEMHKAGAHTKGILAYMRERSGKIVSLRDVHNMIQSFKREQRAGLTDAERALAILDEFCAESTGNVAEIMVAAESKVARVITFQSARMKRLFRAFPEVVLVDATHNTNANRANTCFIA